MPVGPGQGCDPGKTVDRALVPGWGGDGCIQPNKYEGQNRPAPRMHHLGLTAASAMAVAGSAPYFLLFDNVRGLAGVDFQ